MTTAKTYTGGCHCGAVRYEVKLELNELVSCNCSICGKSGTLLAFTPVDQFKLLSGDGVLRDYQFGKKRLHHPFCTTCGVRSFSMGTAPDGREMRAINVRCLDDVDVSGFPVRHFDGKNL